MPKIIHTEKALTLCLLWLAKIKSRQIEVAPFCKNTLEEKINDIRLLTRHKSMDFMEDLSDVLKSCGITPRYIFPQVKDRFYGITFYDSSIQIKLFLVLR